MIEDSESDKPADSASPAKSLEESFRPLTGPELFFAVTGAVGTDVALVCRVLEETLREVRYLDAKTIRLSNLLRSFAAYQNIPESAADVRTEKLMNAGDALRDAFQRGDAMALLAVAAIRDERKKITKDAKKPAPRQAYILHQLKNPEEVLTLRRIYGRAFYLISAFSERENRVSRLAERFATTHHEFDYDKYRARAEELVKRDEADLTKTLGQNVRETFPLADLFVNAMTREAIASGIGRFIDLLFGYSFHTPTPDEFGMFHAQASALRSADLSRQVGAVIAGPRGEIISIGCNDVPRPNGGGYWPGDADDARDFVKGFDASTRIKQEILAEVFKILQKAGWFSDDKRDQDIDILVEQAVINPGEAVLKDAQVMNILEFGRVVHAEMAAISEAARRGLSVQGTTLYCTTFPCRICARHIIASGICRVVYIEPYPKSMAQKLYPEAITIGGRSLNNNVVNFESFLGISPNSYFSLFEMADRRKDKTGSVAQWKRSVADPRLERMVGSYLEIETLAVGVLEIGLGRAGLKAAETETQRVEGPNERNLVERAIGRSP